MYSLKRFSPVVLLLVLSFFLVIPSPAQAASEGDKVYTKYNIHAQKNEKDIKASYSGFVDPGTGHIIIPPNTPIEITDMGHFFRSGFNFKNLKTGEEVFFEVHKGRVERSVEEYIDLITSPKKVSLKGLTKLDWKGVKNGKVYKGMTKKGVMTAMGYPSPHGTPSTKDNEWTYWRNRFRTMVVVFNKNGRVTEIRN